MFKPELKYSRSGMPVISNEDIDALGERMAVDFDHTSLFNPHPIDIERFIFPKCVEFTDKFNFNAIFISNQLRILTNLLSERLREI